MFFTDCCERPDKIVVTGGGRGNCALGPSKSIHYSGDFVIAGFVSTYLTVILPGFQMFFRYNGVFLMTGFAKVGFLCRLTWSWFPFFFLILTFFPSFVRKPNAI